MEDELEKHIVTGQSIGFDYQFYYFVFLLVQLHHGETIGYEVKDDIHIQKPDDKIVLMQAKHTVETNADGKRVNLTTLDEDMWKTLSIWSKAISTSETEDIKKYEFILVTNKNVQNNQFITCIEKFKNDNTLNNVRNTILDIRKKTKSETIQVYIDTVKNLEDEKLALFIKNITFEVNTDNLIEQIKRKLRDRLFKPNEDRLEQIFNSLITNISMAKYLILDKQEKFELTYEDFSQKFRKCFELNFKENTLPKRSINIEFPDNMEDQIFIRQLLDIGEIKKKSSDIKTYTSYMLEAFNSLEQWSREGYVLPTDADDFEKNSILYWQNEFNAKYRCIRNTLSNGTNIDDVENKIKLLSLELLDSIRRNNLKLLNTDLGTKLSNGYYYYLSNKPKIGWHLDWEEKYKI